MTGKAFFRRSRPAGCFACLHRVDLIAPVTRPSSWAWTGNETMEQWFSCSAYRIWWSDLFSVPAEIRRHGCRSRNITESVTATFGRNRQYAESVKIYSFGAKTETETEIRSNITNFTMKGAGFEKGRSRFGSPHKTWSPKPPLFGLFYDDSCHCDELKLNIKSHVLPSKLFPTRSAGWQAVKRIRRVRA